MSFIRNFCSRLMLISPSCKRKSPNNSVWLLILYVTLTELREAQRAGKRSLLEGCVCLWGCFWKRWECESVEPFELELLWVGISRSTEGLNRRKKWRKREFPLLLLEWGHKLLLPSGRLHSWVSGVRTRWRLTPAAPPVFRPLDADRIERQLSFFSSWQMAGCGFLGLYNHVSQCL